MFATCSYFTGKGLNKWNPVKCKNMQDMFRSCPNIKYPKWY